jgi:hypothetical protein
VELIDFDTEKTNLTQNGAKKFGQHYYWKENINGGYPSMKGIY